MSNCEQRQRLNRALPRLLAIGVGVVLCGALAGCGAPVPTERLQSSAAAIRAAEEVGADRVPEAKLHLQLAKEQSDRAKKMIDNGERDEAKLVLARAESDANLALALARTAQEQHQAQVAADRVQSLESQNGQK
jgi:hypothetical protein